MEKPCIICLQKANILGDNEEFTQCPVCGNYSKDFMLDFNSCNNKINLIKENNEYRNATQNEKKQRRALLKYYLKKETSSNDDFKLTSVWIRNILDNKTLPNPIEQIDNLLLYLGSNFLVGHSIVIDGSNSLKHEEWMSIIGCIDEDNLNLIFEASNEYGYTKIDNGYLKLSIKGWERFDNLKKGKVAYNKIFLAMKFGSTYITKDLIDEMKKSLKDIGFELESLQDRPQAGLIDDHLRQRIKNSKALIVDLSDGNNGAYWEGGFGEGLNKPVIYICDNEQFKRGESHFDTNHHLTLTYDMKSTDETKEYYLKNFLIRLQNVIKESI